MTPAIVVLNLALGFAGMALLALAMNRHARAAGAVPGLSPRLLRLAGWALIGLSFVAAAIYEGWSFGPVQWFGTLTGGALLTVALLAYRPAWLRAAALAALPLSLAAFLIGPGN